MLPLRMAAVKKLATVAPVVIVEITKLPRFIRSRSNAPSA